jgi:hypothetical protein
MTPMPIIRSDWCLHGYQFDDIYKGAEIPDEASAGE